ITPLGDGVDLQYGDGGQAEASVEDARTAVADRIAAIDADGAYVVSAPDSSGLVTSGRRSSGCVCKDLLRLVEVCRLTDEGQGKFGIVADSGDTDSGMDQAACPRAARGGGTRWRSGTAPPLARPRSEGGVTSGSAGGSSPSSALGGTRVSLPG